MRLSHDQCTVLNELVREHDAQDIDVIALPHSAIDVTLWPDDSDTPLVEASISVAGTVRERSVA